jgi:hypothetical protein
MFTVFISTLHTHDSTGFATTRSRQLKDIHSAVNAYNQRAFKVKKRSNCKCNKIHDTFKQKKAKFHKSFIDCRLATQQNNHRLLFGKFKRLISFLCKMSLFLINGRNAFILIFLDAPEWRRYKNIDSSRVKRRSRMCKANKLGISLLRIIKHKLCNKNIYKTARNTANQTPISLLLPE